MKRVLFVCTHNSARSQMAEGLVNHDLAGKMQAFSAGTEPLQVNPWAVEAMKEIGIDISPHRSKSLDVFKEEKFDFVITLCDHAAETCPVFFGGTKRIHMGLRHPLSRRGSGRKSAGKLR